MKLYKITAVWCMSCIIMKSRFEKFEDRLNDCEIISLDADQDKEEIKKLDIGEKLPIYIIMDGDKEVSRMIGEKGSKDIEKVLTEGGLL